MNNHQNTTLFTKNANRKQEGSYLIIFLKPTTALLGLDLRAMGVGLAYSTKSSTQ